MKEQLTNSLLQWTQSSQKWIRSDQGSDQHLIYGHGCNGWGIQTIQKAFSAFAILGSNDLVEADIQPKLLQQAKGLLRYNLETHHSGNLTCGDESKWGHTWISVLGIERMMHSIETLESHLDDEINSLIKRVFISEANWLLNNYSIEAGEVKNNKPESNLWNGAFLHRVASMYPEIPEAGNLQEQGIKFLINGISIAEDKESLTEYDGISVSENHIGGNFFDTFSLNHHGYLNVGYMVICLSNIAMYHFSCKHNGFKAPEALYHHAKELWNLIKTFTFDDGRLWRVGGDTRIPYCYCQDYALPMWCWVEDYLKEDCSDWINNWLQQVYTEQNSNRDGSYLGERLEIMKNISPLYYTRLETDRANTLSFALRWAGSSKADIPSKREITQWSDTYHGSSAIHGKNRLASFTWKSGKGPTATCLPPDDSSLCEWSVNGIGNVKGTSFIYTVNSSNFVNNNFEAGFLTGGKISFAEEGHIAEQFSGPENFAYGYLICMALPDDNTMIILQKVYAEKFLYLKESYGLNWSIPNDVFNHSKRHYETPEKQFLHSPIDKNIKVETPWLLVDHKLGITSLDHSSPLTLITADQRSAGIKSNSHKPHNHLAGGSLFIDRVQVSPKKYEPYDSFEKDEALYLAAVSIHSNTNTSLLEQSKKNNSMNWNHEGLQKAIVKGQDEITYEIIANLNNQSIIWQGNKPWQQTGTIEELGSNKLILDPGSAIVNRI
ncbi:MAG: hypothetical protein COA79_08735 [Planctomycetota bacterium]|nr:MAG: hypothetical protein COA79_08735 [Planctomycetota bacterium]